MNYKYYQEVLKKLTGFSKVQKIEYLTETIDRETTFISREVFNKTHEYTESFSSYNNYKAKIENDSEHNRYVNQLKTLLLDLRELKEEPEKYYMKWVSSEEKLDIFLDALPVDFQDRSAFKSVLLNTDHPEHKPHWVDGQNTLIYLFEQLQDEYIKLTEDSLMQTLQHYFSGRVTKRNPTGRLNYEGLKKAHLEIIKTDNIELVKDILKKIK